MTIESSEIFGIHSECHKPTGVEESCVLNFYNDQEENLVTTSVNILTVYRIRKHVNIEGDEKKSFELVEEFELWGTICSICKVRFNGSLRDSILLRYVFLHQDLSNNLWFLVLKKQNVQLLNMNQIQNRFKMFQCITFKKKI